MQVSESSMLHCHMTSSNYMFNVSGGSKCGYKNTFSCLCNWWVKNKMQKLENLYCTLGNCHLGDGKPTRALCIVGEKEAFQSALLCTLHFSMYM